MEVCGVLHKKCEKPSTEKKDCGSGQGKKKSKIEREDWTGISI